MTRSNSGAGRLCLRATARSETRRSNLQPPTQNCWGLFLILNARQTVVEIYLAIERAQGHGSVDKARRAARVIGCKFTNAECSAWLKPFTKSAGLAAGKRTENGRSNGVEIENDSDSPMDSVLGGHDGLTHDNCTPVVVPLIPIASEPTAPQRKPQQPRLRLVPEGEEKAREILAAFWPVIAPRLVGKLTQSAWKQRNKRAALDMAQAGITAEQALVAHAEICEERGDTIFTLKWVHDRILRGFPTGKRGADPKNGCGCDLSLCDCVRLHQDDYPIAHVNVAALHPEAIAAERRAAQ